MTKEDKAILEEIVRNNNCTLEIGCRFCPLGYKDQNGNLEYRDGCCCIAEGARSRAAVARKMLDELDNIPILEPKYMLVSDDLSPSRWHKRMVYGRLDNGYLVTNVIEDIICGNIKRDNIWSDDVWTNCKAIEEDTPKTTTITPDEALEMLEDLTNKKYSLEVR